MTLPISLSLLQSCQQQQSLLLRFATATLSSGSIRLGQLCTPQFFFGTMLTAHRIARVILLLCIALTSADLLPVRRGRRADGLQQPLFEENLSPRPSPVVVTLHSTRTRYQLKTTETTRTRYVANGSTSVPQAVRDWNTQQEHDMCDPAACASCEAGYRCFGERSRWQVVKQRVHGSVADICM